MVIPSMPSTFSAGVTPFPGNSAAEPVILARSQYADRFRRPQRFRAAAHTFHRALPLPTEGARGASPLKGACGPPLWITGPSHGKHGRLILGAEPGLPRISHGGDPTAAAQSPHFPSALLTVWQGPNAILAASCGYGRVRWNSLIDRRHIHIGRRRACGTERIYVGI